MTEPATYRCAGCGERITLRGTTELRETSSGRRHTLARCRAYRAANGQGSRRD